jgi:hypothetical protein
VVEHFVDPATQLGEDGEEDGVKLLASLRAVAGVERLVGQDLVDVEALPHHEDCVAVVTLETVGQRRKSLAADGSVADAAEIIGLNNLYNLLLFSYHLIFTDFFIIS